jgi:hypothetical protein
VTFEVPVSAVSRPRRQAGVVAVACLSGLIVLGAVIAGVGSTGPAPSGPTDRAQTGASTSSSTPARALVRAEPQFEPASFIRPLPTTINCHDVAQAQCRRLVRAALRVLPDELPTVRDAAVWGSLVCNDNFDCPADYLRDSLPAGSVILAFVDGSSAAALNVVDWRYGSSVRLGLRAWMVRTVSGY